MDVMEEGKANRHVAVTSMCPVFLILSWLIILRWLPTVS